VIRHPSGEYMIVSLKAGVLFLPICVNAFFSNKQTADISNSTLPIARIIHFEPIMIFTENDDKGTNPMVTHWACARVHAYLGFSFHAACSWGARLKMPTGIYGRCMSSIGMKSTIVVFVPYLTVVAERNLSHF